MDCIEGKESVDERSKTKLKGMVKRSITNMFKEILDFVEVSIGDNDRFQALRKKILRTSNDTIRDVHLEIDMYYQVTYVPNKEDIITVGKFENSDNY